MKWPNPTPPRPCAIPASHSLARRRQLLCHCRDHCRQAQPAGRPADWRWTGAATQRPRPAQRSAPSAGFSSCPYPDCLSHQPYGPARQPASGPATAALARPLTVIASWLLKQQSAGSQRSPVALWDVKGKTHTDTSCVPTAKERHRWPKQARKRSRRRSPLVLRKLPSMKARSRS